MGRRRSAILYYTAGRKNAAYSNSTLFQFTLSCYLLAITHHYFPSGY